MKTKGMGIALLSAAALLGSAAASAAELPWTYGEIAYNSFDGDDFFEADAFDIKASIGFADMLHASLQYIDGDSDSDFGGGDAEFDGYNIALGVHPQLTPNTQFVAEVSYFDYDSDFDGGEGASADGFGLAAGLRHSLTDNVEFSGKVTWVNGNTDIDGEGDFDYHDTGIELAGRYNWTSNLSTGITVGLNGGSIASAADISSDVIRFDVRWSFLGDVSK